jgi:DNA-binding response OmpR family regulator
MNRRILVVDDTPANIQALSSTLKDKGYQVSVATSGRQALEVVSRLRPDLILLDVMMPEMDGFETCRRLKESTATKDIPVIFLTARTETADIAQGFELGAVDYVAKPFHAHELLARVNTHLTVDELRRNLAEKNVELASATTSLLAFGALLLDWAHRLWPALDRIAWLSPFYYFDPYELVAGSPLCLENLLVLWVMAMTGFTLAYLLISQRDISH